MQNDGLTPKQYAYIRGATRRWNFKCGATRSGKTYLDAAYMIPARIAAAGEGLIVLMGYTQETVARNVLAPMRRLWPGLVGPLRADGRVTIFGRECHILGADKRERAAALQGTGIAYCYGDEVTTWSRDVFEMLKSRLDTAGACFDGTCNPAGPGHWLKAFLDSGADIFRQAYVIDDNPHLPPEFVAQLKAEYAGTVQYDRYILGQWVRAEGVIYRAFDARRHVVRDVPPMRRVGFACDIGHANATCFLAMGQGTDGRTYALREYYHSGKDAGGAVSPLGYARAFVAFRDGVMADFDGALYGGVYVDPSAAGFMAQLREVGVHSVHRARNDVAAGIAAVASRMDGDGLRVHAGCRHLLREIGGYVWDAKAAEVGEDRPVKVDDHAVDALRYWIASRR